MENNDICQLRAKLLGYFQEDPPERESSEDDKWENRINLWERALAVACDDTASERSILASFSLLQREIWKTLSDWWRGVYYTFDINVNLEEWKKKLQIEVQNPRRTALGIDGEKSYFWCLSGLFHQELIDEIRPFSTDANVRDPITGFSIRWFWLRASRVRSTSLSFANIQRLSLATGQWVQNPEYREVNNELHRINLPCCWWLEDPHKNSEAPFYLWDVRNRCTVMSHDLENEYDYTCISHTWGRWRKSTCRQISNVPWEVPENTRYLVEDLPELFSKQEWSTRYLWFDLFCIPQDGSWRANLEIAKQASIFRKAARCVIWMNDVESWAGTEAGLVYFALLYLRNGESELVADDLWTRATHLFSNDQSPFYTSDQSDHTQHIQPGWLSSLWTLQEGILCPASVLADRHWRLLKYKSDITVTLENLTFCIRRSLQVYTRYPDAWVLPPCAISVFKAFNLPEITDPSRISPFVAGSFRQCTSNRAEAVMSVMGVTDWYLPYIRSRGNQFSCNDLLMQKYPLEFVRETAQKVGAAFYFFWHRHSRINLGENREILIPGPQTILPLVAEQLFPGQETICPENIGDLVPHPSVNSWTITSDAKVHMKHVTIIDSSEQEGNSDGEFLLNRGGGWERRESLQHYVSCGTDGRLPTFVSLGPCQGSQLGLTLEPLSEILGGSIHMKKIAIFFTAGSWCLPELAVERSVDWLVT